MIEGQINLRDAVNGTIAYQSPEGEGLYLNPNPGRAHLPGARSASAEKHVTFDGAPFPAACRLRPLFPSQLQGVAGQGLRSLLLRTQAAEPSGRALVERGVRLDRGQIRSARGTIKATVLIEPLPAVFEMDELLYQMKDHIVALNCGRWDYIFSYIKTLKNHPDRVCRTARW